ncbi:MAG TPA: permease [Acidobacteriaceae bacterium]
MLPEEEALSTLAMRRSVFRLQCRSLTRGTLLVGISLASSFVLSGFPEVRPAPAIALPLAVALWGSCETARCLGRQWSWYHSSVLLLLGSDVMALTMMLFLLIFPYARSMV